MRMAFIGTPSARWRAATVSGLLLHCASAFAKHAQLEEFLQLELEELVDVRVDVASHFTESQLNAASTVALVTSEQWDKRGARRLSDAIGHLPSTIVLPNWFSAEQIMIRGYANGNNSGGISTLWDGVPVASVEGSPQFNRQNINLGTLDRIEMIRGPGSALHGENAFHGVLSMAAFESATDVTRAVADAASNDYYHASVKHSQALSDGVRAHVSAGYSAQADQHRRYDYFEPPGSSERAYEYRASTAVVKLTSDPTRDVTWNAGLYWDDNDSDDFLSAGTSGPSGLDGRDIGGVDSSVVMARGGMGYHINDKTYAEAMIYYWTYDRTYTRTFSLTRDFVGTGDATDMGAKVVLKQTELLGHTQWSAALDTRRQRMGDAFRTVTENGTVVIDDQLAFSDFARDINSLSFDADTAVANGKVHLRYGARVDDYSDFGTQTTPRAGMIYHPTTNSAWKFLYGEGFRAPNALEVEGSASIAGNPDIEPETISTYELVYMLRQTNTLTELALFKSRWEDAIVTAPTTTPGFTSRYVNTGTSEAQGAELSFTLQMNPWTLETSGSYVHSENVTLDQDYAAFPQWILNAGVGYRFVDYKTEIFVNERAHLGADEGQITTAYPDPQPLPDYWRTDVHVATRVSPSTSITFDVRNLFNRDNYLPSIQANPSTGGIPEDELSVKIGLRYAI